MVSSIRHTWLGSGGALLGALVFVACGTDNGESTAPTGTSASTSGTDGSTTTTAAGPVTGTGGMGTAIDTVVTTTSTSVGTETSSVTASSTGGASSTTTGTDTGTTTGSSTTGGMEAPAMLSETGLFTARVGGQLMLGDGVREFQPRYALWSDGALKNRYIYLPPGTQIDTEDPDHWVFPAGTKLWKSFSVGEQLVETRLIERLGDGENDWRYATYIWETTDATDAMKLNYKDQWIDAANTTHDIPSGSMCERCHDGLKEKVLGFSALQLNHDLGGLNLATLMSEGLLTDEIPLDIGMPGEDEMTQNALGYLHANCGNCHNDAPGVPVESVPEPRMLLRVLVGDQTLEDTGTYKTAINQAATASDELPVDWRIYGSDPGSLDGNTVMSAVLYRMNQRGIEDQMPPLGTSDKDLDGLALIQSWILSLPAPVQ